MSKNYGHLWDSVGTSGGNKHILVISDYYTKWTECFAMPNMEAKLLVEEVIVRFGIRLGVS